MEIKTVRVNIAETAVLNMSRNLSVSLTRNLDNDGIFHVPSNNALSSSRPDRVRFFDLC